MSWVEYREVQKERRVTEETIGRLWQQRLDTVEQQNEFLREMLETEKTKKEVPEFKKSAKPDSLSRLKSAAKLVPN